MVFSALRSTSDCADGCFGVVDGGALGASDLTNVDVLGWDGSLTSKRSEGMRFRTLRHSLSHVDLM